MQDIYLIFQNEEQALSILYIDKVPNYQNIDIIGIVYKKPPTPTPINYVPEIYPAPNWGVNIRLLDDEDIEPLKPYIVTPVNPIRVWG